MTKVTIVSGFLGAGKTTLIKKLLAGARQGEKVVLIENEFGETGIDGSFLRETGIEITEMNSGCICCSLVGDFSRALLQVTEQFEPDRIVIEPSGVGKLSDVVAAVEDSGADLVISGRTVVVDAVKCRMYEKNFGEFYNDQIESASSIVLSRSQKLTKEKLADCEKLLRSHNEHAAIVTTPWDELDAAALLRAIEPEQSLEQLLRQSENEHRGHGHEHHHHGPHEHDETCECGHHHHGNDHDHDHEHHHDHDHGHDADEVFAAWGFESSRAFDEAELAGALDALDSGKYGVILRAKGIVPCSDGGQWLHFDYVPQEHDIRRGAPDYTGRLCVIGSQLDEAALAGLFGTPDKR